MNRSSAINGIISIILLWSCFFWSISVVADQSSDIDPYQNVNQKIFSFNKLLDDHLARPVAKFYVAVTPDFVESGIANVFDNLKEVANVFNDVLQGKFSQALNDTGRFGINSTLGMAGLMDVASLLSLKKSDGEDFGQTLGYWGVPEGPYLMLPFFGPSTLRDAPSKFVDQVTDPLDYLDDSTDRAASSALSLVNARASLLDYDNLLSGDSYTLVRDVYLQRRAYQVTDGAVEDEFDDLDDY
ncbi:MAG: VacJ family lipoprotein [Porticoccaceae bacterium]|nr:VacJ family lipoprotein [Porticoccaceae bacterium]